MMDESTQRPNVDESVITFGRSTGPVPVTDHNDSAAVIGTHHGQGIAGLGWLRARLVPRCRPVWQRRRQPGQSAWTLP